MYTLVILIGIVWILFLALAPFTMIPSRIWGVILIGFLIEYLFPNLPDAAILIFTAIFGLLVRVHARQYKS